MQALLPATGGANVNGTGLAAALKRINGKGGDGKHKFFDGAVNTIAKHFAYTNAALGQIDATVIANIPYYAVFTKGGARTCVGYNPSDSRVTGIRFFLKANPNSQVCTDLASLDPNTMVTVGASNAIDRTEPPIVPTGRLYLRKTTATGDCQASTASCAMDGTPGTFLPAATNPPFPPFPKGSNDPKVAHYPSIAGSLVVVPPRSDVFTNGDPLRPPPPNQIQSWTGAFSGTLVPDPLCTVTPCDANIDAVTTAVAKPGDEQCVCLNDNRVRCHQTPAPRIGLCEKSASALMGSVFHAEQSEEPACVDKDALHFAS